MVTPIESSRTIVHEKDNRIVKVDVTGTYVLPLNILREFANQGLLTIDIPTFSKTIQGEAFLALSSDFNADLVIVNRMGRRDLHIRYLNGYSAYWLYVDNSLVCKVGSLDATRRDVNAMRCGKEAISKMLKLKSVNFTMSQLELDEVKKRLFG